MREQAWIDRYIQPRSKPAFADAACIVGPGDDAALLTPTAGDDFVLSVDQVVAGVHYVDDWLDDGELAERALLVALSDLVAMGARATGVLLAIVTPDLPGRFGAEFWAGVDRTLADTGAILLGGNVTRAEPTSIAVTVLGRVHSGQAWRRDGARPGDRIFVTGTPGRAGRARQALFEGVRDRAVTGPWLRPTLHDESIDALREELRPSAAIDISDGLGIDAARVASASGVTFELELGTLIARSGLTAPEIIEGGEDYELLLTSPSETALPDVGIELTEIGRVVAASASGPLTLAIAGEPFAFEARGWDPWRAPDHD